MTSTFYFNYMVDTYPIRNSSGTITGRHYNYVPDDSNHISIYESGNYSTGDSRNTLCDGFLFLSDPQSVLDLVSIAKVTKAYMVFNVSGRDPSQYALTVGNSGFSSLQDFRNASANASKFRTIINDYALSWPSGSGSTAIEMSDSFRASFCNNPAQGIAVFSTRKTGNEFQISSSAPAGIILEYDYKASAFASDTDTSADIGSSITTKIQAYSSTYTHKIRYRLTDNSYTSGILVVPTGTYTYTFNIPIAWCNAVPDALSTLVEITLWSFDDTTSVGARQMTATLNVPSSVVPTAGSISYTTNGSFTVPAGNLPLTLSLSGQAGVYSSTIKKYIITAEGLSSENSALQISKLTNPASGVSSRTMAVSAQVFDSRGRSATVSTNLTVYYWDSPYFTSITVQRCDSSGVPSADGHYIKIDGTYTCYSVNGENSLQSLASISIESLTTGTTIDGGNLTSGTPKVVGGGNIAADEEYVVRITLVDEAESAVYSYNVYSAAFVIHCRNGGRGVAFGMASNVQDAVQINPNWQLIIGNNVDVGATLADLLARVAVLEGNS